MPAAYAFWICGCAFLNCAGWLLSALHQLNAAGYGVALLIFGAATLLWTRSREAGAGGNTQPAVPVRAARGFDFKKYVRRFRQPLPAIFLLVAGLVFLGGLIYPPSNYDALTYRLPRMLNWLAAGHWHWIASLNERMNYSGTAWEWTALPLLTLTHSDRALFLINALGFLLLPGLLFAIFRRLGVARRVAWTWMWILPLGYGLATQAGSIGNDLTGAVFCLLAVYFGLRARRSDRVGDVWLALLATALLTGVKLSNLPLALPCLVAVGPALPRLWKNRAGTLAVAGVAVLVSALPIMALNQRHTGSWTGDPLNAGKMRVSSPAAALLGNSLLLAEGSLMPPVLPGARPIGGAINRHLPAAWTRRLKEDYPRFFMGSLNELPGEEGAGLGLGVTLLLLAGGLATVMNVGGGVGKNFLARFPPVALAAWIAIAVFLLKLGSEAAARLLLPYYCLAVVPLLRLPAQRAWLRFRAWRIFLALMAASVLPALVLSVSRPLWPAQTVANRLAAARPGSKTLARLATTYTAYAHRNDVLASVRAALPDDAR